MKKLFLLVALAGFVLASCNKDQRAIKKISDGEWEVTSFTDEDGENVFEEFDTWTGTANFEECKQKDGDCNGTMKIEASTSEDQYSFKATITVNFTYSTSDKGTMIDLTVTDTKQTTEQTIQGQTETDSDSGPCTEDCNASGTINDDYTEITITDASGATYVLKKK